MHKAQGAVPRFDLFDPATTRAVGTHAVAKKRRRGQELAGGGADEDDEAEVFLVLWAYVFVFVFVFVWGWFRATPRPLHLFLADFFFRMRTDPPCYT